MEEGSHLIGSGSTSSALAGYWMTVLYFVKFLEITMYATNLYTYIAMMTEEEEEDDGQLMLYIICQSIDRDA